MVILTSLPLWFRNRLSQFRARLLYIRNVGNQKSIECPTLSCGIMLRLKKMARIISANRTELLSSHYVGYAIPVME